MQPEHRHSDLPGEGAVTPRRRGYPAEGSPPPGGATAVNRSGPYGFRLTRHRTALRHGSLSVQYARRFTGSAGLVLTSAWSVARLLPAVNNAVSAAQTLL